MTELTKEQADAMLAEMMGYRYENGYLYKPATFKGIKELRTRADLWGPSEDIKQALGCLENIRDKPNMHFKSIEPEGIGYYCYIIRTDLLGNAYRFYGYHEDLSIAISQALCSAISGEQCKIGGE